MRIRRFAILFTVMLLLTVLLTGCQQKEEAPTAETNYQAAIALLQEGKVAEAEKAFSDLGHYYDASRYALYCRALEAAGNGNYALAASTMQALDGFMDSSILAAYWTGRGYEESENYEDALKQYALVLQYEDAGTRAAAIPGKILERDYKTACALEEAGSYRSALSAFRALDGYSDSEAHIASIEAAMAKEEEERARAAAEQANAEAYAKAEALETAGKLEEAAEAFRALGEYSDSAARAAAVDEKILERDYQAAARYEQEDDLPHAYVAYGKLGDYKDAAERAEAIREEAIYRSAFGLLGEGCYDDARTGYLKLGDYKDSAEKARLLGVCEIAEQTKYLNSGVVAFRLQGKWGYIDLNNNYDIAPKYDSIGRFSDATDLAVVTAVSGETTYYGLINRRGEVVAANGYIDLREGEKGFYTAVRKDRRNYDFVLISPEGKALSSWRTLGGSVNSNPDSKYNSYVLEGPKFTNGVMIAMSGEELYSLINDRGETVLTGARAIRLISRKKDLDTALVRWGESSWMLAALDGTPLDANAWMEVGNFTGGYAAVCSDAGLWGYIRTEDCHVAIEPQYQAADAFAEGLAAVRVNGLWGFIDGQNNMVIQPQYTEVTAFSHACAVVRDYSSGWQVIDQTGKLMFFKQDVYLRADELDRTGNYEQAIAAFESLEGYADSAERAVQSREKINATVYAQAEQLEAEGRYIEAAESFEWLGDYSDAPVRAEAAREKENARTYASAAALEKQGDLEGAIAVYLTLGDYNGSAQHAADLRESINRGICAEADELEAAGRFEEAIRTLRQIPEYTGVAEHIASLEEKIRVRDYNAAAALEDNGKFEEAIIAFTAMGDYSDSKERITALEEKIRQRDYNAAAALEENGKFEEAIAAFTAMGDYSDSKDRIAGLEEKIRLREYNAAAALEEEEKFEEAIAAFAAMGNYKDSKERIAGIREKILARDYKAAEKLEEEGKYAEAYEAFIALGAYSDSAERATAVTEMAEEQKRKEAYAAAEEAETKGQLEEAAAGFEALGDYSDAKARLENVREQIRARDYNAAVEAMNNEDYGQAVTLLTSLGAYKKSADLLAEAQTGMQYQAALAEALAGNLKEAYNQFVALGEYKDSAKKAEICGNLSRASKTQEITAGVLIYDFHDLWGIANLNTNVITAAKYTKIIFNEDSNYAKYGLLEVYLAGEDTMKDTYGYINQNGKEIIPCSYVSITDFTDGGYCTAAIYKGTRDFGSYYYPKFLFGIINSSGKIVTESQWRTMGTSQNTSWTTSRYLNSSLSYCDINQPVFTEGRMMVQKPEGQWGFIDEQGKVLGEVRWSSIGNFSDGMAMVAEKISVKSGYSTKTVTKYGFINKQGQTVGEVRWDAVNAFSNGYAAVQENGLWGFINKNNELVIPCRYTEVAAFSEDGTCDVKTKDGTWQVINTLGEVSFF